MQFQIIRNKSILQELQNFTRQDQYIRQRKSAQLKLKCITLYYSLYIGEQGILLYFNDLLYFEYINIERIELISIYENNALINNLCSASQQEELNQGRKNKNGLISITFVFTDNTPYLGTLKLYCMDLNDLKTSYIKEEALQFFSKKPSNYKFNIKKINFCENNSLAHQLVKIYFIISSFFLKLIWKNQYDLQYDRQLNKVRFDCWCNQGKIHWLTQQKSTSSHIFMLQYQFKRLHS